MELGKNDPPSDWRCAIKEIEGTGIRVGYSDRSLREGQVGAGGHASSFGGGIIAGHSYIG